MKSRDDGGRQVSGAQCAPLRNESANHAESASGRQVAAGTAGNGSAGRGIIGEHGEEYITQREYAALHGVSASSVHMRAVRGLLPVIECVGYKLVKKSAPYPELKPGPLKREKMQKLQCSISVCSVGICCKRCQYRADCADVCLNSPERCGCAVKVKGGAK